jgi:hypothetical protein
LRSSLMVEHCPAPDVLAARLLVITSLIRSKQDVVDLLFSTLGSLLLR